MSYILEALKKAQSERQLGTAPTIHTLPIATATNERERRDRVPMMLAAGGVLLALAAGLLWWRQGAAPAAPASVAVLAVPPAPQPQVIVVPSAPVQAPQAYVPPAPVQPAAAAPVPVPVPAPVQARAAQPTPTQVASAVAPVPPAPAPARAAPAAAPQDAPAPTPEDNLPFMAQLPDAVQRDLPRVTFGGYMYSKNPADRLILIDKSLRKEGDEVAPGLILEQLQPRAAVMNYRGTRYRVAY